MALILPFAIQLIVMTILVYIKSHAQIKKGWVFPLSILIILTIVVKIWANLSPSKLDMGMALLFPLGDAGIDYPLSTIIVWTGTLFLLNFIWLINEIIHYFKHRNKNNFI